MKKKSIRTGIRIQKIEKAENDKRAIVIPLSKIQVTRNPRQKLENIEELAASIKESDGLLQPLVVAKVKDEWELIAGARRLAALKLLGAKEAPVRVIEINSSKADVLRLVENLQRDNLSGWETCKAVHAILPQYQSQRKLADAIGKTESYVSKCIAVVNASPKLERVQDLPLRELFGKSHSSDEARTNSGAVAGGRYVDGAIQLKNSGARFSLRLNFDPERTPEATKAKIVDTLRKLITQLEAPK